MQGYWGPHAFIAAQTPLPDTMADFWSMVYQKRASAVVMLSDCEEGDEVQAQCPSLVYNKYFVTLLKLNFQVSVFYSSIFF